MDPEHKHRLQIAWAQLLETVGNVIGVVDGLFAKKVITRAMKERIMVRSFLLHSIWHFKMKK